MATKTPEGFWRKFLMFKAFSVTTLYGGLGILSSPDFTPFQKEISALGLYGITIIAAILLFRKMRPTSVHQLGAGDEMVINFSFPFEKRGG